MICEAPRISVAGRKGLSCGVSTHSSQIEVVENLTAALPHVCIPVLVLALVVEAVYLGNLPRFVVASEQGDAVRPPKSAL